MSSAQAYPLQWPEGFPRSRSRERGKFKTPHDTAIRNVVTSLRLFASDSGKAISAPILSSNIDLLTTKPTDPGVALWFTWDGLSVCIPVDRYDTPAANIQAIHHIIEARRVELRHGTLALVRATFQGFKALPAPGGDRSWQEVLEMENLPPIRHTAEMVEKHYREIAKKRHPDRGGSTAAMAELNAARDRALKEVSK